MRFIILSGLFLTILLSNNCVLASSIHKKTIYAKALEKAEKELKHKRNLNLPRQGKRIKFSWEQNLTLRISQDLKSSNKAEAERMLSLRYDPKVKVRIPAMNLSMMAGFDLKLRGEYDCFGKSTNDLEILPGENYLFWETRKLNLFFGWKKFTWGKLDKLSLLDRVNPYDMREFFVWDKDRRKLPVLNLGFSWFAKDFSFDFIVVPFFSGDKYLYFNSDWAVFGRLKENILNGAYQSVVKSAVDGINIVPDYQRRKHNLSNVEYNFRLRKSFRNIDVDLYYMYHHSHTPILYGSKFVKAFLYNPNPTSLNNFLLNTTANDRFLKEKHPLLRILGADFETTFMNWGLRGEFAWFDNMAYLNSDYSVVSKDTLFMGLGADYTFTNDLYVNVQMLEQMILDYVSLYGIKRYSHNLLLRLSKTFLDGDLKFSLDWVYRFPYGDWMVNPEVSYRLVDGLKLLFGGYWFSGDTDTVFGPYKDKDFVYTTMKIKF